MPKAIRLYVRSIDAVTDTIGLITMYLIFAMVAILLLDAVTRNVIHYPLSWCIELAQFVLTGYYFAGGAYTMRHGDHVRMDLIYERLSDIGKARIDAITNFALLFYLVCMLIGAISSTAYAIRYDQRNFSMWNPSMVPIKVIMVCGLALMILQAVSILCKDVAKLRGKEI